MSKDRFFYLLEGLPDSTRIWVEYEVGRLERRALLKDANWEGFFYGILESELILDVLSAVLSEKLARENYVRNIVKDIKILIGK